MEIDSLLSELIIGDVSTSKDDPVGWIEKEFYIPELKGPMKLAPYHKAVMREAYRKDADGRFLWSDGLAAGDRVVTEGQFRLKAGSKVTPLAPGEVAAAKAPPAEGDGAPRRRKPAG